RLSRSPWHPPRTRSTADQRYQRYQSLASHPVHRRYRRCRPARSRASAIALLVRLPRPKHCLVDRRSSRRRSSSRGTKASEPERKATIELSLVSVSWLPPLLVRGRQPPHGHRAATTAWTRNAHPHSRTASLCSSIELERTRGLF